MASTDAFRRDLRALLATVTTLGLLVASCSRDSTTANDITPAGTSATVTVLPVDEGTPRDGGRLVFGLDAEPDGFDPTSSQFANPAHMIVSSVLESLAVFDHDHHPQPYLAESITPADNAQRWTIRVKPDISFSDGAPLNGEAVKANLDAARNGIGGLTLKLIDSVSVVDDRTIDVHMSQPWSSFPSMLAGQIGYEISPATLGTPDVAAHPVGTGPFVFDHWDRGTDVVVTKNPHYWQARKPHLDQIEFRIINDPDSRASTLASGGLDVMTTDKPQTIVGYRSNPDFKTIVDASGDAKAIVMNEASPPFDNVNARRALVLASDPAALTDTLGAGVLQPIDQPFADGPYHVLDAHYPTHDLEAAKKAAKKYTTDTGQPLTFTFTTYPDSTSLTTAQVLQSQWAQAGIKADIDTKDQAALIKVHIFGKTQASNETNFGYPDPDFNYIFWSSSFTAPVGQLSINFPHLHDDALDQTLLAGRTTLDPARRQAAYKTVVQMLNDNLTYVWLYRYVDAIIAANKVHGLKPAEAVGFSSYTAKSWYADLWLDS